MKQLVIFGAGEFAELAHYYFTHDSPYTVAAFAVDAAYLREDHFHGLPVLPFHELERHHPPPACDLFVALGIGQVNRRRAAKLEEVQARGYRLASFLSSRADVSGISLRP